MKKKQSKKLLLSRESLRVLQAGEMLEAQGGKNSRDVTYGGQALGCPSECCTTEV